mgnify:CR=1 FL=1
MIGIALDSIGNPFGLEGQGRTSLPNFAGKLRWMGKGGSHIQLGADVFRLEWQGGDAFPSDAQMGFGATLSGRHLVGASKKNAIVAIFFDVKFIYQTSLKDSIYVETVFLLNKTMKRTNSFNMIC